MTPTSAGVGSTRRRAVFLDKDGTLLRDVPYNVDPARMELMPGAVRALRSLRARDFLLFVVSNQSGVARGYFDEEEVIQAGAHLTSILARHGVTVNGFYHCPHLRGGPVARYAMACECRKPKPGLLLRAARDHNIDLPSSWMVGDILDDIEAGNRAGCTTILLDVGSETQWLPGAERAPDHVATDLIEAASIVLCDAESRRVEEASR